MLSISEILACHHDAKLLPKPESARHEIAAERSRRPVAFRLGLRVTIGIEDGEERCALAHWDNAGAADVTITELA